MAISEDPMSRPKRWVTWPRCLAILGVLLMFRTITIDLVPWARSFFDSEQLSCDFNTITTKDFEKLLGQARTQPWQVEFGDLTSKMVRIDRGAGRLWGEQLVHPIEDKLLARIQQLIPSPSLSPDDELAATHAVMRSIGAKFADVVDSKYNNYITVRYTLPGRRLDPYCIGCFFWPYDMFLVEFARPHTSVITSLDRLRYVTANFDLSTGRVIHSGGVDLNKIKSCPTLSSKPRSDP
jgi:hypothetical protein